MYMSTNARNLTHWLLLLETVGYHDAKKLLWEIILANASPKGGRIDAAHHNGHAVRALSETLAFDKAIEVKLEQVGGLGVWSSHLAMDSHECVQEVLKLVNLDETLVLVTADHAHTMR